VTVAWVIGSPFQCSRSPWVHRSLFTFENAIEEIVSEQELCSKGKYRSYGDERIHIREDARKVVASKLIITTWEPGNTYVVHRNEYHIQPNECEPEMNLPQGIVHHFPVHFREPVVDSREQTKCS